MKFHIVKKGETMPSIAEKYNISLDELMDMNKQIANPDMIMTGMKVKVPMGTTVIRNASKNVLSEGVSEKEATKLNEEDVSVAEDVELNRENKEEQQNEDLNAEKETAGHALNNNDVEELTVADRNFEPPVNPNKPKPLPRITEDESVLLDKEITFYDEEEKEEMLNNLDESKNQHIQPTEWTPSYTVYVNEQEQLEEQSENRHVYDYEYPNVLYYPELADQHIQYNMPYEYELTNQSSYTENVNANLMVDPNLYPYQVNHAMFNYGYNPSTIQYQQPMMPYNFYNSCCGSPVQY